MARWMLAFACGSMSTRRTRLPASASAAARLTVQVVFPTPPFWFMKAMARMVRKVVERGGEVNAAAGGWRLAARGAVAERQPESHCIADLDFLGIMSPMQGTTSIIAPVLLVLAA